MTTTSLRRAVGLLAGALAVTACKDLTVPDYNNGDLNELQRNPTPSGVITVAQGLLFGTRQDIGNRNDYVVLLGILGREGYNFDAADPRFVTEMLVGPLDGGSPAFGGNLWANPYANIRGANVLLNALDLVVGFSDGELEALRGFAKTIQALDFLVVINTRDDNGAAIDVDRDLTGELAPIVSRAEVFAHIAQLLDEAEGHLTSGDAAFPEGFAMTTGFAGFDTPATFLTFNRALRARVAVYTGDYATALTALSASFLDDAAPLTLGVYHVYSTGSGDLTNGLYDPSASDLLAHPSIVTDAQTKANSDPDDRVTRKIRTLTDPVTVQGITTQVAFQIYNSLSAPVPIIRNEELILLRAEANLGQNQDATTLTDINLIRTTSGGLDPIDPGVWAGMSDDEQLNELLYNKRYSLLFEGGHRWIDLRRYGRLDQLPVDLATHVIHPRFPFPVFECDARAGNLPPAGC
jgi:starch-binding outer membrane protein, SusD/RagB family